MSEENGGKDPMPAPPSFIPSAGRKKTESQPHKSTIPSQSGSPSIPSFSPAAQPSRSSAPHASRRTAQPSSVTPSGSSAPQSFRPAANSTSRPRKSASSSPASFAPASAPNNHRASQQVRGSSSIPTGMPRTTRQNTPRQPLSGNSTTGFQSTAKAVLPHRKRHMGRVILAFFLAVILALGLSIFSAWNWVDGQLNKQSWLTNKADTAGESWLILGSDEREGTIGDAGDVTGFRTDTILVLTKPKSGPSSLILSLIHI